ncbi:hypothetical protein LOZ12_001332 [Ophidiomyces ophidiicola]|uniref:Uncharacterized protein n=1 Tax=Ophidiomyces ophidiicola TaxID=1387563 RepID=A0ACB8URN2_9EURO|nr:uncharacterized protein LOZ57_002761 [Ophidiomyces ophidiicola]KAI1911998.1 hypothetical protein LOZ61_003539 [Ophidiomyces ophidiicola]KAI1925547.1 hypothetical protein LOZ60_004061 [Ophidiomyces ophidiicola]KAI1926924.1 hypothetical protein LOZ64_000056 [Ophidiomyces ophidiicola]KAI1945360.1 hypothetical protein LOZ62_003860 [Ophidiomyces ophidiicola]KAI1948408.1 hypothetical protein LOZ57_002761 [Ophidiomyces ophidiicola]
MSESMGMFDKLPWIAQERIWEHLFADVATMEADLSILRVSRGVYRNVAPFLYQCADLDFDILPQLLFSRYLCLVTFKRNRIPYGHEPKGLIYAPDDASCSFGEFPFHLVRSVQVSVFAPIRVDGGSLYLLWNTVRMVVDLLRGAVWIKKLAVCFYNAGDQSCSWGKWSGDCGSNYDYNIVARLFCSLKNVGTISVEPRCGELIDIDWKEVSSAVLVAQYRMWDIHEEYSLSRRLDYDYLWIHLELFTSFRGAASRKVRSLWLSDWYYPDRRASKFETRVSQIMKRHPDVIAQLDPHLRKIRRIHRAMVTLYAHAMQTVHRVNLQPHPRPPKPLSDSDRPCADCVLDTAVWGACFPAGVPAWKSTEYQSTLLPILASYEEVFKRCFHSHCLFSTICPILLDWVAILVSTGYADVQVLGVL